MYIVLGGNFEYASYDDSSEIYDKSLGSWYEASKLPGSDEGIRAANIDNRVLFFGWYQILFIR